MNNTFLNELKDELVESNRLLKLANNTFNASLLINFPQIKNSV